MCVCLFMLEQVIKNYLIFNCQFAIEYQGKIIRRQTKVEDKRKRRGLLIFGHTDKGVNVTVY